MHSGLIATAVPQRRRVPFVGREAELRVLEELLRGEARVVWLHGIAGMGKSAVLRAFAERAHGVGAGVVGLDCRTVEPTERGLLRARGDRVRRADRRRHRRRPAPPGGETGWHIRPAESIATVQPGAPTLKLVTQRHGECEEMLIAAGEAFLHPAGPHNLVNTEAGRPLNFGVAYFVPVGATLLTPVPAPKACR